MMVIYVTKRKRVIASIWLVAIMFTALGSILVYNTHNSSAAGQLTITSDQGSVTGGNTVTITGSGIGQTSKIQDYVGSSITLPQGDVVNSLTLDGVTAQAGSGNPSPTNIRPINVTPSLTVNGGTNILPALNLFGQNNVYDQLDSAGSITGQLVYYQFTGNENITLATGDIPQLQLSTAGLPNAVGSAANLVGNIISSHFAAGSQNNVGVNSIGIAVNIGGTYIRLARQPTADTVAGFKAWLQAQAAAGTPVQIVYQLATPTVSQADPIDLTQIQGGDVLVGSGIIHLSATHTMQPTVTIGGQTCFNLIVVDNDTLTCTVPAGVAGTVDVTIATVNGSETLAGGYTYIDDVDTDTANTNDVTNTYASGTDPSIDGNTDPGSNTGPEVVLPPNTGYTPN